MCGGYIDAVCRCVGDASEVNLRVVCSMDLVSLFEWCGGWVPTSLGAGSHAERDGSLTWWGYSVVHAQCPYTWALKPLEINILLVVRILDHRGFRRLGDSQLKRRNY